MSLFLPHQSSAVEDEPRPVIALSLSGNHRGPEPLHLEFCQYPCDGDKERSQKNFGPEARDGACSAELVLSDSPVLCPYVTKLDILDVMSQEAYVRFAPS
jgi:hypothetical protein